MRNVLVSLCVIMLFWATAGTAKNLFDELLAPLPAPANCDTWASIEIPAKVCKQSTPSTYEIKSHYFGKTDFSWKCNSTGSLELEFFNSSSRFIDTIIIEGATSGSRLSQKVSVPPGKSEYLYILSTGGFCNKEQSASLYFNFKNWSGGSCRVFYSTTELRNMRESCVVILAKKQLRDTILNNCFIAKSRGASESATGSIWKICKKISESPTALQKWRWGN